MALTVQELFFYLSEVYGAEFCAGKEGVFRTVSWGYYIEDKSIIDDLKTGSCAVCSLVPLKDNEKAFLSFINTLNAKEVSVIIILKSHSISSFPSSISELCNNLNLALIMLPNSINIASLMQGIADLIIKEKYDALELTHFFSKIIENSFPYTQPQILKPYKLLESKQYLIILLSLPEKLKNEESLNFYLDYSFNPKINLNKDTSFYFIYKNYIVYIISNNFDSVPSKISLCAKEDKYFFKSAVSLGNIASSFADFALEYRHAVFAMCFKDSPVREYKDLGIYKILSEVKDTSVLLDIYNSTLGKLSSLSKEKYTFYINTLSSYLEMTGSINETASSSSVHRNTVSYRINKLSELLGMDLKNGHDRYLVQTALYIKTLMEKAPELFNDSLHEENKRG